MQSAWSSTGLIGRRVADAVPINHKNKYKIVELAVKAPQEQASLQEQEQVQEQ